jgi:hypothetical protein
MNRTARTALAAAFALALLAIPASAAAWKNVSLIDQGCSVKAKANPDAHARDCALQCSKSGYGIYTAEGQYLKLDEAGSQKALAALKASTKKDHLRADVTGEVKGDVLTVATLDLLP